jgi:hypothetical protein
VILECEPEVVYHTEFVPIPEQFTKTYMNKPIPSAGDNLDLLEWAQYCAVQNRKYELQMEKLQELE